jgi:hypothetical protein
MELMSTGEPLCSRRESTVYKAKCEPAIYVEFIMWLIGSPQFTDRQTVQYSNDKVFVYKYCSVLY